jgi:hypothetical protein
MGLMVPVEADPLNWVAEPCGAMTTLKWALAVRRVRPGVGLVVATGSHGHQQHHRDDDEQPRQHPPRLGEDVEPLGEEEHASDSEDDAGDRRNRIRGVALHDGGCGGSAPR